MLRQRWIGLLFELIVRSICAMRVGRAASGVLALAIAVVALVQLDPALLRRSDAPASSAQRPGFPLADSPIAAAPAVQAPGPRERGSPAAAGEAPAASEPMPAVDVVVARVNVPEVASRSLRAEESGVPLRAAPQLNREQTNIARFIARRYQVAIDEVQHFVDFAYKAGGEVKLDPMLILAVISVESSFDAGARSKQGAQGLMQVLTRVHAEKFVPFGGVAAAFDPLANIRVGARILREYVTRLGSVEAALKSYVGAAFFDDDSGYGNKVLQERAKLAAAAAGRPIPVFQRSQPPEAPTATAASAASPPVPSSIAAPEAAEADRVRVTVPASGSTTEAGRDGAFLRSADIGS